MSQTISPWLRKQLTRLLLVLCILLPEFAFGSISLKVPIVTDSPAHHQYFFKLLIQSFAAIGHKVSLRPVRMPQQRAVTFLQDGRVDVFWMLPSQQRDRDFVRIDVALTEGLIGQRVLLIRPQDQEKFEVIHSVQDLKESTLTAGLSALWVDAEIWRINGLKSKLYNWSWQEIFRDLHDESSGIDYFPRGVHEVVSEVKYYPRLAIEQTLVMIYDRDLAFYVSHHNENDETTMLLRAAMIKAHQSGLIKRLVSEFWGTALTDVKFEGRRRLLLSLP